MQWNLIRLRKEHDETQVDLADLLGISLEAYRLKESGSYQFKANEMFKLSEHYSISIEQIFLPIKYTNGVHK